MLWRCRVVEAGTGRKTWWDVRTLLVESIEIVVKPIRCNSGCRSVQRNVVPGLARNLSHIIITYSVERQTPARQLSRTRTTSFLLSYEVRLISMQEGSGKRKLTDSQSC